MIIKIKLGNGTDKDVEVSVKKKHRNSYLDKVEELQKSIKTEEDKELVSTKEFLEFEDELAVKCSNISQEEYDDLD